ncbi:MAG: hypothetical protein ACKVKG_18410 [Alphaproteobacteria bacterium]|jgi:hypothetical protein
MDERDFEFLDRVVDMLALTSKTLIAEARSLENLDDVCYGSLLAACILHSEKLGVTVGCQEVTELVNRIFDERELRETLASESASREAAPQASIAPALPGVLLN